MKDVLITNQPKRWGQRDGFQRGDFSKHKEIGSRIKAENWRQTLVVQFHNASLTGNVWFVNPGDWRWNLRLESSRCSLSLSLCRSSTKMPGGPPYRDRLVLERLHEQLKQVHRVLDLLRVLACAETCAAGNNNRVLKNEGVGNSPASANPIQALNFFWCISDLNVLFFRASGGDCSQGNLNRLTCKSKFSPNRTCQNPKEKEQQMQKRL